jgi:hypothetical protein
MTDKQLKGYRLGWAERTGKEQDYAGELDAFCRESEYSPIEKASAFPLYSPRQTIATFLFKYEIFKKVVNVHGSVVECGVAFGAGLMGFAQFSAILEPVNYTRRVIGFDTFSGFPDVKAEDARGGHGHAQKGGMKVDSHRELERAIGLYDANRPIGHIPKVELVRGDALETIPRYVEDNPHLVISLLYLDFDLYEPTKLALEKFLPRMPRGAVIAFDELAHPQWPGETLAVMEAVGLKNLRLERFPFDTTRSFAVLD